MNELTQATNHALEQINQATTNADVDNAKGDGLNAINPIAPVTVVKQAARDAVSHDAQQHIAEIMLILMRLKKKDKQQLTK